MAHNATFLMDFDPEPFLRRGLNTTDFLAMGFVTDELELVGIYRLSKVYWGRNFDEAPPNTWHGYCDYMLEKFQEEEKRDEAKKEYATSGHVDIRRVAKPLCWMEVHPDVVNDMITDIHPYWLENGTDFKYQRAKAILWDNGEVTVSNITLIRSVGDPPLINKELIITDQFLKYFISGNIEVVEPWDVPEYRTELPVCSLPGIDTVLGHELTVPAAASYADMIAELARRNGVKIAPSAFCVTKIGHTSYIKLAADVPFGGMIMVRYN